MRAQTSEDRTGWILAGLFALLIAALFVAGVFSDRGLRWDFVSYYNAGARLYHAESQNLYRATTPIAGQQPFFSTVFDYIGLPLSAYLLAPLAAFSPERALWVFKLFCAACVGAGLLLLFRAVLCASDARWGSPRGVALFLAAVAAFGPLWMIFAVGGQLTAVAFLLLGVSFVALRNERAWVSAVCFSAAILFKPFLLPSVWVFAIAREWGWLTRFAVALAIEAGLSLALFGFQIHADWFELLRQKEGIWAAPWWNNAAVLSLIGDFWYYRAGQIVPLEQPPPPLLYALQWVFKLGVVALFARLAIETRRSALSLQARREHCFALAILLPLLFATTAWPHYLLLFLIPLTLAAAATAANSRSAALLAGALLLSALRPDLLLVFARGPRLEPVVTIFEAIGLGLYGRGALLLALLVALFLHPQWLRIQERKLAPRQAGSAQGSR